MGELQEAIDHIQLIEHCRQAAAVLFWEAKTGTGIGRKRQYAKVQGTLTKKVIELQTDPRFGRLLQNLLQRDLDEVHRKQFEFHLKNYQYLSSLPVEEFQQFSQKKAAAYSHWASAKRLKDFKLVEKDLADLIETQKRFAYLNNKHEAPYNQLLDRYEPGIHTEKIDCLFKNIKDTTIKLLDRIQKAPVQPDSSFFRRPFPLEKQEQLAHQLLTAIGYRMDAGKLAPTLHPFSSGIHPDDARLAVKYAENDVKSAALMTLHEGGHSLYNQNISKELVDTGLAVYTSMGLHESQAIFWEKMIGKHKGFWKQHFHFFQKLMPEVYSHISLDQFYFSLCEVKPSLIRYEADDITYPLHVIIRYEIEKDLFADKLKVSDLPEVWNDKYRNYLGIVPQNDCEGVLQDVHWYFGLFGYFPSYLIGFIYAAQLREAMIKDMPNFDVLAQEDLSAILKWKTKHIYQYGKLKTSKEILKDLSINEINEKPLLTYLTQKYEDIYRL